MAALAPVVFVYPKYAVTWDPSPEAATQSSDGTGPAAAASAGTAIASPHSRHPPTPTAIAALTRPRRPEELDTRQGGGAVFNQAAHQVDEELSKQVKELSGGLPGVAGLKIPGLF